MALPVRSEGKGRVLDAAAAEQSAIRSVVNAATVDPWPTCAASPWRRTGHRDDLSLLLTFWALADWSAVRVTFRTGDERPCTVTGRAVAFQWSDRRALLLALDTGRSNVHLRLELPLGAITGIDLPENTEQL